MKCVKNILLFSLHGLGARIVVLIYYSIYIRGLRFVLGMALGFLLYDDKLLSNIDEKVK
jgi:hypothetical protein